ncbi:hypothetical protein GY45DRAFT_1326842 [Cubamyces sp. BRFM 1775]|nr:hypothetical protein GY45DRAFT_1326842 [Cubamyces sp. BRFM 1775]
MASLFSGQAWFSPRVPTFVKETWTTNGGALGGLHPDASRPGYLFCDGNDDPWFQKLYQRSVAVFHWQWISAVVEARFRVSISRYIIDARASATPNSEDSMLPAYATNPIQVNHIGDHNGTPMSGKCLTTSPPRRRVLRIVKLTPVDINERMRDPPSPSPQRGKRAPFIDLSRMKVGGKGRKTKRPKRIDDVPRDEQARTADEDLANSEARNALSEYAENSSVAALSGLAPQVISISAAMEMLDPVETDQAVQFIPGVIYLGQEFRCFYLD